MARRIAILAFIGAAAFPALFAIVLAFNSATGCPDACGAFGDGLRLLASASYFGMFTATLVLFLVGVAALAVHASGRR